MFIQGGGGPGGTRVEHGGGTSGKSVHVVTHKQTKPLDATAFFGISIHCFVVFFQCSCLEVVAALSEGAPCQDSSLTTVARRCGG